MLQFHHIFIYKAHLHLYLLCQHFSLSLSLAVPLLRIYHYRSQHQFFLDYKFTQFELFSLKQQEQYFQQEYFDFDLVKLFGQFFVLWKIYFVYIVMSRIWVFERLNRMRLSVNSFEIFVLAHNLGLMFVFVSWVDCMN